MRAILIDPTTKTITEVDFNGNYRDIYRLTECDCFTAVKINEYDDVVYVDDEGLLKDEPGPFFIWNRYPQPLAGKGLILGTNQEGDSVEPKITLEQAKTHVIFPENIEFEGFEPIPEGTTDNRYGIEIPVVGSVPIFKVKER